MVLQIGRGGGREGHCCKRRDKREGGGREGNGVPDGERGDHVRGRFCVGACLHKDDVVCEGRIDGSGNGRKVASDRAHRHFGEEEER